MARARARKLGNLDKLLRSDWERVIFEASLGKEDTQIARMYLLDAIPQVEIGAELGLERSTISRRLPRIIEKVGRTAEKMNLF